MNRLKFKDEFYVIYGKHAVEAVLQNQKRKIYKLFIANDLKAEFKSELKSKVEYISRDTLTKMCKDGDKHQGYVAHVGDLIEDISFDDWISIFKPKRNISVLILDKINDPHNFGAILRSARCFDVDLVVTTKHGMPKVNGSVIRSSAGMSEYINIVSVVNLNDAIQKLKDIKFNVIGLDIDKKSVPLREAVSISKKVCLVLGSEGYGIRDSVRESCSKLAHIKMNPDSDSLNVSNAAAIAMYEVYSNL